jgi:hypothetical protein
VRQGKDLPQTKTSDEDVVEIFRLAAAGLSYAEIGRRKGLTSMGARAIVKGLNRRGVGRPTFEPDGLVPAMVRVTEGVYRVLGEQLVIPGKRAGDRRILDALIDGGRQGPSTHVLRAACRGYIRALNRLLTPGSPCSRGAILPPTKLGRKDEHWRMAYVPPDAWRD